MEDVMNEGSSVVSLATTLLLDLLLQHYRLRTVPILVIVSCQVVTVRSEVSRDYRGSNKTMLA